MEVIIANALPIVALMALTFVFRLLYDNTRFKKVWLILDVVVHLALFALMIAVDASMEELLLVLLFTLAVGLA
jgi:hypothetical protein